MRPSTATSTATAKNSGGGRRHHRRRGNARPLAAPACRVLLLLLLAASAWTGCQAAQLRCFRYVPANAVLQALPCGPVVSGQPQCACIGNCMDCSESQLKSSDLETFVSYHSEPRSENAVILYVNQLSEFPTSFVQLFPNLKVLDLGANAISDLSSYQPHTLTPHLEVLYANRQAQHSCLHTLPTSPKNMFMSKNASNLQFVDVSDNCLGMCSGTEDYCPSAFFKMHRRLTTVHFAHNSLESATFANGTLAGLTLLEELILHNNKLNVLPEFSALQTNLSTIDLANNDIESIEEEALDKLSGLETLMLSGNKLTMVRQGAFRHNPRLKVVELGGNELTNLSTGLFHATTTLHTLDISHNNIKTKNISADHFAGAQGSLVNLLLNDNPKLGVAPGAFRGLGHLKVLNMANIGIAGGTLAPDQFASLTSLAQLQLHGNHLESLHALQFDRATMLKTLTLNNNKLASLPGSVFLGLTRLDELTLDHNALTQLPQKVFAGPSGLSSLTLHCNHLTAVPNTGVLDTFKNLTSLTLNDNRLTDILPPSFDHLVYLTTLPLDNNRLTQLRPRLFRMLSRLTHLSATHNHLTHLDEGVFDGLDSLTMLNVSGNLISAMGQGVFTPLPRLVSLNLSHNRLLRLPSSPHGSLLLAKQTKLENLDLSNNYLTSIPKNLLTPFGTKLQFLQLRHNDLPGWPNALDKLPALIRLDLAFNKLRSLPRGSNPFQTMGAIKHLDLSFNSLTQLSDKLFTQLPELQNLYLNSNALTAVPTTEQCPQLQFLVADHNRLEDVPFLPSNLKLLSLAHNRMSNLSSVHTKMNSWWVPTPGTTPYVGLASNPVSCTIDTGAVEIPFTCSCAIQFHRADSGLCEPDGHGPTRKQLAGYIVGAVAGTALLMGLAWFMRQQRKKWRDKVDDLQEDNDAYKSFWNIDFQSLTLEKSPIGRGSFGDVYLATYKGKTVAVKVESQSLKALREGMTEQEAADFQEERKFLSHLRHDNIVGFHGGGKMDDGSQFLVLEYMNGGELAAYLAKTPNLSWAIRLGFAQDIAAAMKYIHDSNRMHRDLKCANVLLLKQRDGTVTAKVADFGTIKKQTVPRHASHGKKVGKNGVKSASDEGAVGTPVYMAPEVSLISESSGPGFVVDYFKADIWSFGVVLWEIVTQLIPDPDKHLVPPPAPGGSSIAKALQDGSRLSLERPGFDYETPRDLKSLLMSCWDENPSRRPNFEKLHKALSAWAKAARKADRPRHFGASLRRSWSLRTSFVSKKKTANTADDLRLQLLNSTAT